MAFDLVGKAVKKLRLPTVNYNNEPIKVIQAQQGDTKSRYFTITLFDDRGDIDLSPYFKAVLNATLPDESSQISEAEINHNNNSIICELASSMLAINGHVTCDITLIGTDSNSDTIQLTTRNFYVLVVDSQVNDEAIESTNEYALLVKLLAEFNELEKNVVQAENERQTNESTRNKQEDIRQDNESIRLKNEEQRVYNEDTRLKNEEQREERIESIEKDIVQLNNTKVDKIDGKGLSTNDYTTEEKEKLKGVEKGAEVNVQSDWSLTDSEHDGFIKNKPTIGNATLTIQRNETVVGTFTSNATSNKTINIVVPNPINNLISTSSTDALAAAQGKVLKDLIENLKNAKANKTDVTKEISDAISSVVNSAPEAFDTLKEIADWIKEDEAGTEALVTRVSNIEGKAHQHSNKELLDSYSQTDENLADAVAKKHSHSNKSILDNTTASYTTAEKNKLAGVFAGAEPNVQSDWNQTNSTAKDFIKNKPVIPEGAKLYSDKGSNTDGAMTQKAVTEIFAALKANQIFTGTNTFATSTISKFGITDVNIIPSSTQYQVVNWGKDTKGNVIGVEDFGLLPDGSIRHTIDARRVITNSDGTTKTVYSSLIAGIKKDGTLYTTAVTPPSSSDGVDIVTTAWINSKLQDFAKLNKNQTFTGNNTFTHELIETHSTGYEGLKIVNTGYTRGNTPSSTIGLGRFIMYDAGGQYLSYMQAQVDSSGYVRTSLLARQATTEGGTTWKQAGLTLIASKNSAWANMIGTFQPASTNQYSLGEPNLRWKNLYLTNKIDTAAGSTTYLVANQGNVPLYIDRPAGSFNMIANVKSTNGTYLIGSYQNAFHIYYTAKTTIDAGTNNITKHWDFNEDGTMTTIAPSGSDNSTKVPTTAWVNSSFLKGDLYLRTVNGHQNNSGKWDGYTFYGYNKSNSLAVVDRLLFDDDFDVEQTDYNATTSGMDLTVKAKSMTYDLVIRTQADFEALLARRDSSNTISGTNGIKRILFVGDGGSLKFTHSGKGIGFNTNIECIHGINNAIIENTDFLYDSYDSPAEFFNVYGEINNITISIQVTKDASANACGACFHNCSNMQNCVAMGITSARSLTQTDPDDVTTTINNFLIGYSNCMNLLNCESDLTGSGVSSGGILYPADLYGYHQCILLISCKAYSENVNESSYPGEGFKSCTHLINPITDSVGLNKFPDCKDIPSLSQNGYIEYSNGLIVQWGLTSTTNGSGYIDNIKFPIAFSSNSSYIVAASVASDGSASNSNIGAFAYGWSAGRRTSTQFTIRYGNSTSGIRFAWIAIGY